MFRTISLSLFAGLVCAIAPVAEAESGSARLGVSMTILPDVDVATLPEPVQRLDTVIPGYGNRWANAKSIAATDPLLAVRTMRSIHAEAREDPAANSWVEDMQAAGQHLISDCSAMQRTTGFRTPS